jgi:hypothetical protein
VTCAKGAWEEARVYGRKLKIADFGRTLLKPFIYLTSQLLFHRIDMFINLNFGGKHERVLCSFKWVMVL